MKLSEIEHNKFYFHCLIDEFELLNQCNTFEECLSQLDKIDGFICGGIAANQYQSTYEIDIAWSYFNRYKSKLSKKFKK